MGPAKGRRGDRWRRPGPGKDRRSFLGLRAHYDAEAGQFVTGTEDSLIIENVSDLEESRNELGTAVAIEPLAVGYWIKGKLDRYRQIVHHDLVHSFLPGESEGTGRHFFSAV